MDGLPIGLLNGVGVVTLVLIAGWMFATSRLYTRGQVAEMQRLHTGEVKRMEDAHTRTLDDANHERNEWRTEARLNQQTVVELGEQNRAMLSAFGPTLTDFLDSLRRVSAASGTRLEESDR